MVKESASATVLRRLRRGSLGGLYDNLIIVLIFIIASNAVSAHNLRTSAGMTVASDLDLNPNQRRVLDVIWRHGPIARVDIGARTDMSTMGVTRTTKELLDHGLLVEDVLHSGGRGQPVRPLTVRADAAYAVGVYFTQRLLQVAMVDLSGVPLWRENIRMEASSPAEVAKATQAAINQHCTAQQREHLVGVGVALPGDFIADKRRLNAHALFPGFRGDDLQAELQAHLDEPVHVENDAASAALGERLLGVGQTINSFFFAHIGMGVGGGIIINGRLHRGTRGNAGIIGVQYPNSAPRPSGQDLMETLNREGVPINDLSELETLTPQSCPPLKQWLNRASAQLHHGLWITARVLDPDAVIIGGHLPTFLLQEIVARVDDEAFCNEGVMVPRPKVFASSLGPAAGVIGAAAVPLYHALLLGD